MATPTEAEIQAQISASVHIFEELREFGSVDGTNFLGLIDALRAIEETDYLPELEAAVEFTRSIYASVISQSAGVMFPLWLTYGAFLDEPAQDIVSIFGKVYDNFVDNTLRVTSRGFTFGAPAAAGANVGDGVLNRLTTDEEGFDIENQTPDGKRCVCVADKHSGAQEGEESFRLEGSSAERDNIRITGSGRTETLTALTGRDSAEFISNPSFGAYSGTGASLVITDWVVGVAITNFSMDTGDYYRTFDGEGTAASVAIGANDKLVQNTNIRRASFSPGIPMYAQVALNRKSTGANGTVTFRVGASSVAVVLTSLSASGWNILRIPIGTASWFSVFNDQPLDIEIEVSGATVFGCLVDDVILAPFSFFDGGWYALVGGATPFLLDDLFTFTDSATGSVLQKWFWRAFGAYLPHGTGGAVTWADP